MLVGGPYDNGSVTCIVSTIDDALIGKEYTGYSPFGVLWMLYVAVAVSRREPDIVCLDSGYFV